MSTRTVSDCRLMAVTELEDVTLCETLPEADRGACILEVIESMMDWMPCGSTVSPRETRPTEEECLRLRFGQVNDEALCEDIGDHRYRGMCYEELKPAVTP
jgi:hypothetical protein